MPVAREFARMARIYHGMSLCHQNLGDHQQAMKILETALTLFSQEHDLSPVPPAAWLGLIENELAIVLMRGLRDLDRADGYLQSALQHMDQSGTERVVSHIVLTIGELRAMQGRTEEAFSMVREAIGLAERLGEAISIQQGFQQLGALHAERGEHTLADEYFERAAAMLQEAGYTQRLRDCLQAWDAIRQSRRELDATR